MPVSVTTPQSVEAELTDTQQAILEYLRRHDEQAYFKSRLIGEEIGCSAKEVGANMAAVDRVAEFNIDQWGYSAATTWQVTDR